MTKTQLKEDKTVGCFLIQCILGKLIDMTRNKVIRAIGDPKYRKHVLDAYGSLSYTYSLSVSEFYFSSPSFLHVTASWPQKAVDL